MEQAVLRWQSRLRAPWAFVPLGQVANDYDVEIKVRRRRPDARRKVKDPKALKIFVDAVVRRDTASLPESQQALAIAVLNSLEVKPTVNSVIEAIAAYRGNLKHDWKGIKKGALKDNYYRPWKGPRGQAPRTKRARQTALRQGE